MSFFYLDLTSKQEGKILCFLNPGIQNGLLTYVMQILFWLLWVAGCGSEDPPVEKVREQIMNYDPHLSYQIVSKSRLTKFHTTITSRYNKLIIWWHVNIIAKFNSSVICLVILVIGYMSSLDLLYYISISMAAVSHLQEFMSSPTLLRRIYTNHSWSNFKVRLIIYLQYIKIYNGFRPKRERGYNVYFGVFTKYTRTIWVKKAHSSSSLPNPTYFSGIQFPLYQESKS